MPSNTMLQYLICIIRFIQMKVQFHGEKKPYHISILNIQSLMTCHGNTPTEFFDEQLPFHCSFMYTIVG